MILIIIKFCELLLQISPRIINSLRSYIKHSKKCFLLFLNISKLVKKNSAAPRFSNLLLGVWKSEETLFLVFDLLHPMIFDQQHPYMIVNLTCVSTVWNEFNVFYTASLESIF